MSRYIATKVKKLVAERANPKGSGASELITSRLTI